MVTRLQHSYRWFGGAYAMTVGRPCRITIPPGGPAGKAVATGRTIDDRPPAKLGRGLVVTPDAVGSRVRRSRLS